MKVETRVIRKGWLNWGWAILVDGQVWEDSFWATDCRTKWGAERLVRRHADHFIRTHNVYTERLL